MALQVLKFELTGKNIVFEENILKKGMIKQSSLLRFVVTETVKYRIICVTKEEGFLATAKLAKVYLLRKSNSDGMLGTDTQRLCITWR